MKSPAPAAVPSQPNLTSMIDDALARIPPLWPLKHFVAVNPFVGLVDRPFPEACALLERAVGAAPVQSPTEYLAAFRTGTISPTDLAGAADAEWPPERLLAALEKAGPGAPQRALATVADLLDQERPRAHWQVFIVEEISKWCGSFFDENQTTWKSPWTSLDPFPAWRAGAVHDRNPEAFGLVGFRAFVRGLPDNSTAAIEHCLGLLIPGHPDLTDFLHRQLATVAGWAGYVQYRVREDLLRGRPNPALRDLLAIRLAYDAALFQAFPQDRKSHSEQLQPPAVGGDTDRLAALVRWQTAYEAGFQRQLARALCAQPAAGSPDRPTAQAVFCIDVRSEVFRRHLEAAAPGLRTTGFAGFFGFPIAHRPAAAALTEPAGARCPVLLVPPVETCEPLSPAEAAAVRLGRAELGAWKAFQNSATSCFSFVESAGLAFGALLGRNSSGLTRPYCAPVTPGFAAGAGVSTEARAGMGEGALRNMSLTRNFPRLVLFCGHGSQSANNPYASALDCGACGGHAGDVNARLAATTLNDPAVRAILAGRGITIPDDTLFVAGLHNTTTDDVTLLDVENAPGSHAADLATLRQALIDAGQATRLERAPSLGLAALPPERLVAALNLRAHDISQVRPEWGLANNAALVAAPRSRTAALRLDGRVFLHDYDADADPENKVLTLILCAPVVVASWINLQYYASRIDPARYGSGNKVIHNVIGGLGVMEGNAGDLKVGLPLQSIHDGTKFVHEPRRLTVYLAAARDRIEAVLTAQPGVRQLFDHGWIHLVALEGERAYLRTADGWRLI